MEIGKNPKVGVTVLIHGFDFKYTELLNCTVHT